MKQRLVVGGIMVTLVATVAWGQSVRSLVNGGNDLYEEKKFSDAEVNYRKAVEKEPASVEGHFNLGNSLHKQGKTEESLKEFEYTTLKTEDQRTRADAYYNMGNSHLKAQQYQDAVKSYVDALKLNPADMEAKYNLSYALEMLKQQQQQQQNKKDKNKDNKNEKDKNDQQKDKQQQQDQEKQRQQQQEKQQQQRQQQGKQMSKADAERILDVLKDNEKNVQKKLRVRQAVRPKGEKDW
jgi:tetratricopeptide (TPR) repeat protein